MGVTYNFFTGQLDLTGTGVSASGTTTVGNLVDNGLTANKAVASDASKQLVSSTTSLTELSYVTGVTSAIQTQLNAKVNTSLVGAVSGVASLDSSGHVPVSQLPGGTMEFLGSWNATTNSPSLADGTGVQGSFYRVSVGGTQNLGSGSQTFVVGDFVFYTGSVWELSHGGADSVQSVNGATGTVTIVLTPAAPTSIGALDAQAANATGLALVSNVLSTQSADATHPGMINNTTQTISGNKAFSGVLSAPGGSAVDAGFHLATDVGTGLWRPGVDQLGVTVAGSNVVTIGTSGLAVTGNVTGTNLSGTNTGDQTITLTGAVTGTGTGSFATTLANASVTGQVLTGYVSGAGTVAATDTILQAIDKLNGNIAAISDDDSAYATKVYVDANGGDVHIASAGSTTALTASSPRFMVVTGSLAQTIQLPTTSTLTVGETYVIINRSTGLVTVTDSTVDGGGTEQTLITNYKAEFRVNDLTGDWDSNIWPVADNSTGTIAISNILTAATISANTALQTPVIETLIGSPVIDINNFLLKDNNGYNAVAWNLNHLTDISNALSVDWNTRKLYDSAGVQALDWSTGTNVAVAGTITGSNLSGSSSGSNSGDQTITLTGDVTGSGTGSFSTTLSNAAVIAEVLTGFSSGAGTVTATDSILTGIEKAIGNAAAAQSTANAALPSSSFTDTAITGQVLTGYTSGAGTVAATDTILQAINKLNGNDAGKLIASAGDINETQFTAADNQATPANVTGLAFANGTVRSFEVLLSIVRGSTYAQYRLNGIQRGSDWAMTQSDVGDVTGLTFTITSAGQIQYTSTSTGSTANLHFRAITTSV